MSAVRSIDEWPEPDKDGGLPPFPLRARAWVEFVIGYAVLAAVGIAWGLMLVGPFSESPVTVTDRELVSWWLERRTPALDDLTAWGSGIADTHVIVISLLVVMVALTFMLRRWRESLTLGVALGLEASVFLTVSLVVGRERPPVEQLDQSPPTASFPSGHTGAAFAFFVGLALVLGWNVGNRAVQGTAMALALAAALVVGASRMYRGMHFLTDVVVGAILGIACLWTAVKIVARAQARHAQGDIG